MKVFYSLLLFRLLFSLAIVLLGSSCASSQVSQTTDKGVEIVYLTSPPPVKTDVLPPTYKVKRGDTLFTIARQFELDYRELAKRNDIGQNYIIVPGQVLRLTGPIPSPEEEKDLAQVVSTEEENSQLEEPKWVWPVPADQEFDYTQNQKGLDISVEVGAYTLAAADGQIVYAGEELEEYGQLILISHSQKYLSVYGHNGEILAKEGQKISRGERIARPAIRGDKAYLYFEIRLGGKSVDPLSLLPAP